jgi:UPF0755 protein
MPKAVRFILKFLSVIIAIGLISCALAFWLLYYFNAPPKEKSFRDARQAENESRLVDEGLYIEEDTLFLEVRNGESADSVGRRLESAGVIKNRYFWYLLFRLDKDYMRTGSYRITLPATQTEIRSILVKGEQILVKVTVPEGVTLKKTAVLLESAGICKADEFLRASSSREILAAYNVPGTSMEGYLYPDTYLFTLGYPASSVVMVMADTFYERLDKILSESAASRGSGHIDPTDAAEMNKRVIIASIVEREYRVPEEAAVMAGVFYNRLNIGMALQSCATVEYVITEIQGRPHPEQLFNRDLEIRDPYNTYIRPGLPPGPISAPGETALRAAFNPESTEYLYFRLVDQGAGRHYFSRTLDDHIRAGILYVKGN